jgi:hypothetical protein
MEKTYFLTQVGKKSPSSQHLSIRLETQLHVWTGEAQLE